jgi:hypothetical protein
MSAVLTRLMDRYRGRRGLLGYLVWRADVRRLKKASRVLLAEVIRRKYR